MEIRLAKAELQMLRVGSELETTELVGIHWFTSGLILLQKTF